MRSDLSPKGRGVTEGGATAVRIRPPETKLAGSQGRLRLPRVSLAVPCPGGPDDGREIRMGAAEFQDFARRGCIRNQIGRVTRSPRFYHMGHLAAGLGRA